MKHVIFGAKSSYGSSSSNTVLGNCTLMLCRVQTQRYNLLVNGDVKVSFSSNM